MDLKESLLKYLPSDEVDGLLASLEKEEVTHALLLNTKKMSDEEFVSRFPNVRKHPFVKHAYLYDKDEYEFGKNLLYDDGVYSIEDPSAMMVNYFLDPKPGEVILDICGAPGGKSIGASLAMEDEGLVIANDISYPRAKAMSQNVERMGRGNMIVASNDFVFSHIHFANTFDKIILDAPCSGSAMIRKNEKAAKDWRYEKVKSCAKRQNELLELAYSMLKEGGIISYSTCSFSYEEDEGVLLSFKEKHPEIEFVSLPDDPSFYHLKELPSAVRLHPNHFEGEGQFIALLRKPGVLTPTPKTVVSNTRYKQFLSDYGLSERSNEIMRSKFYSLSMHFDVSHLNILRYGVKLFEIREIYIPDHHLSHFLGPEYGFDLTYEECKAYISGNTFPCDKKDGFYIVTYDNQNLGYVKVVQGTAKNHYPKGLRRSID